MIIETDAIVLHRIKYKNSSLIARIFTKDEGKISIVVNGAGRQKSNLFGIIEPSNIIQLNYYKRKPGTLQICKNARFLSSNLSMKKDIVKLSTALAMVEIIDKTLPENDVHSEIYDLGEKLINKLSSTGENPKLILIYFFLHIMSLLGFMLNLNNSDVDLSDDIKIFLSKLYDIEWNDLMHLDGENIDYLNIIIFFENYIKHHLKLNQNIRSLTLLKELTYG